MSSRGDVTSPQQQSDFTLSLSLLRLSRPSLACNSSQNYILYHPSSSHLSSLVLDAGTLVLPPSFGNIYLGEPLHFALHLNHGSSPGDPQPSSPILDISIKVELQTTATRSTLLDTPFPNIPLGQGHKCNLVHDVRELGMHILVVQVSYNNGQYLRKFFKFQSLNPFQIKTKTSPLPNGRTLLELAVQNLTQSAVLLTRFTLVPNHSAYTCQTLDPGPSSSLLPLGTAEESFANMDSTIPVIHLMPLDIHQTLYLFTSSNQDNVANPAPLGRLELEWDGHAGAGRLQTPQLPGKSSRQATTTATSNDDIDVTPAVAPSVVPVAQPFTITLIVANSMRMTASLLATFVSSSSISSLCPPLDSTPVSSPMRRVSVIPGLGSSAPSTPSTNTFPSAARSSSPPTSVIGHSNILPSTSPPRSPRDSFSHQHPPPRTNAYTGALSAFRLAVGAPPPLTHAKYVTDPNSLHLAPGHGHPKPLPPRLGIKDFAPTTLTLKVPELTVLGPSNVTIGDVAAGTSTVLVVRVVGLVRGIHSMPNMRILDAHTGVSRTLDPRVHVWVGGDTTLIPTSPSSCSRVTSPPSTSTPLASSVCETVTG